MNRLEELKRDFGGDLGEKLYVLEPQILRLQHDWQVYRSLFGANEDRWNLLHEIGGTTTRSIENALWNAVILSLCRLTDLRSGSGAERVTIHQLSPKYVSYKKPESGRRVKQSIKKAVGAVRPIREIRDARIAHMNLDVALYGNVVDTLSRYQIDKAVSLTAEPIKIIHEMEKNVETLDRAPIGSSSGAIQILNHLYLGKNADRRKVDRSSHPDWLKFGEWD